MTTKEAEDLRINLVEQLKNMVSKPKAIVAIVAGDDITWGVVNMGTGEAVDKINGLKKGLLAEAAKG